MKPYTLPLPFWLALCGLGAASLLVENAAAQSHSAQKDSPRIVFLHLRATSVGFELIDAKIAPGLLKSHRYDPARDGLHFDVVADDGLVLFQGISDEPTVRKLEYEDPTERGQIISQQVVSDTAEFTIRVPYFAKARKIQFFRRPAGLVNAGTTEKPKTKLERAGEITLPSRIE